jgi:hypothetical protein
VQGEATDRVTDKPYAFEVGAARRASLGLDNKVGRDRAGAGFTNARQAFCDGVDVWRLVRCLDGSDVLQCMLIHFREKAVIPGLQRCRATPR